MPMMRPRSNESQQEFVSRFMGDATMVRDYPDQKQRAAVAYSQWRRARRKHLEKVVLDTQKVVENAVAELRDLVDVHWVRKDESLPKSDGQFSATCELCKVQDENEYTFVWGPVLVPESMDKQGDVIAADEIEKAAHSFLEDSGRPGLLHRVMLGNRDATVVESGILRKEYAISKDRTLPEGTWVLGMRVYNRKVRDLIIGGKLRGFSIGGHGTGISEE
jgi:hypothetical protein